MQTATKPTTVEDIRHRRQQRTLAAQQDYTRLITIAATKPEMSPQQAHDLDEAITTLGITLDEMDLDIAAIKQVNAAEASKVPADEINRLDQLAVQAHTAVKAIEQENADRSRIAFEKSEQTDFARRSAKTRHSNAFAAIETARNNRPRAFGVWA